jgi:predicted house-cleaning noncanonical NTP pyrophosphatase (MazG superfamily)
MKYRLLGIIIALAFSAGAYILRQYRSKRFLESMETNPSHRTKIMEDLDTFYRKLNIDEFPDLFELIMRIPDNTKLNKYSILKIYKDCEDKVLCLTTCTDFGFKVSKFGIKSDTQAVFKFNFVIKQNSRKSQYEFYSDDYRGLNEKNLKSDFRDELVKFLQNLNSDKI